MIKPRFWFTRYRVKPALPKGTTQSLSTTPRRNDFRMRLALKLFGLAAKVLPSEFGWQLTNRSDEARNKIGFLD